MQRSKNVSGTTKQTNVFFQDKLVALTNQLVQTKVSASLQNALFSEQENFYQSKQHDLNLKVSELSKSLSDLESRSRNLSSPLSDYRTTSSKSSSRPIFKSQNSKVKSTSSPIFYGKAGMRIKLKKDMTSDAKCGGTDSSKSVKPHTPKSQRGLYKQVYVPVAPKLILIYENTSSNEKGLLKENLQQLNGAYSILKIKSCKTII